jgi:hypothetical protein
MKFGSMVLDEVSTELLRKLLDFAGEELINKEGVSEDVIERYCHLYNETVEQLNIFDEAAYVSTENLAMALQPTGWDDEYGHETTEGIIVPESKLGDDEYDYADLY